MEILKTNEIDGDLKAHGEEHYRWTKWDEMEWAVRDSRI